MGKGPANTPPSRAVCIVCDTRSDWPDAGGGSRATQTSLLDAVGALADQGEEFGPRFFLVAEAAQHRGGNRGGVLLFDAAHHHAEVAGFDDDANALRLDYFLDGLG